ncbi:hypothetical protein [Thermogutta sp.]|uniref:tetratricopeptide repeat protein n=1 Tax=Thermogutta sp. TaxID=1962930 RepID=UPI0032202C3E
MGLILRAFHVYVSPAAREAPLVHVIGRRAGLIAYVLTLLGLQNETHLRVTPLAAELETRSLFGVSRVTVPVGHIASVRGGVRRPLGYLIAAIICTILALSFWWTSFFWSTSIAGTLLFLLVALGLTVLYFLRKSFFVKIYSQAGLEIAVAFFPSFLESKPLNLVQAMSALDVLRNLLVNGGGSVPPAVSAAVTPPPTADSSAAIPATPPGPIQTGVANPLANAVFTGAEPATARGVGAGQPVFTAEIENEALQALRRAVITYNEGNREEGIRLLEGIVRDYPGTKVAKIAQGHLSKLGRI